MRVVFCGSGTFAVPTLRAILDSTHEVTGVVTQPPRRAGRGGGMRPTPAAELARGAGLALLEPPDVNDEAAVAAVREMRPDAICVAEFGQMLRPAVRGTAPLGAFNVHASLLPELRGAAPVNWAIIRGYAATGVTTFSLVDRMDAGPIYMRKQTPVQPGETAEQLRKRLAELGAEAACETLGLLADGRAQPVEQDGARATLAPRLVKADGLIDWSAPAEVVANRIHGTWPWPGGRTANTS